MHLIQLFLFYLKEDLNKLRFNSDSLIPVLVNAIKELTTRLELLEGKLK
jgi:hypothetical protein